MIAQTYWLYSTVAVIFMSILIALDLIVLVANALSLRKLPPSSFLIFWLCFCGAGTALNPLIIASTHLARDNLAFNNRQCQIHGFFTLVFALMSLCLCTGLTLFRYLVVVWEVNLFPQLAPVILAITIVTCSIVAGLPFLLNTADTTYVMLSTQILCTVAWYDPSFQVKLVGWVCVSVLTIPIFFIGFAYASIYRRFYLSMQITEVALVSVRTVSSSNLGANASTSKVNKTEQQILAAKTDRERQQTLLMESIALVTVFLIGWAPYFCAVLYELSTARSVSEQFEFFAQLAITTNNTLNPILALVFDHTLRGNVKKMLRIER
ncbi:hypothetical protein BC830DRAFT_1141603 [Chytriomyces sp. MP71]|nr:hypothetical protein BC830DRAFT_1141603 [Chytriomyces sp. MP71]